MKKHLRDLHQLVIPFKAEECIIKEILRELCFYVIMLPLQIFAAVAIIGDIFMSTILVEGQTVEFSRSKKFKFVRILGSGGTGETRLFRDETTDMLFAIKKYSPKGGNNLDECYLRFVDEIKILFRIAHPNIVRIYNYYLYPENKLGYLQMEFIHGTPIDEFEFMKKPLDDIFVDTVKAFSYLESNHILHRDIRPSNILIDDSESVKIIDFGFGKILGDGEDAAQSVFLNWPATQMPLEITKDRIYTHRTEIYFLGCLFKSISGVESFKYSEILNKMVEVDHQKRYASFEEIIRDLSRGVLLSLSFSYDQKQKFQTFLDVLSKVIGEFTEEPKLEENPDVIVEKLSALIRRNSLKKSLSKNAELINCFVKCGYKYYRSEIPTSVVSNFFSFFCELSLEKRQVVIENINSHLQAKLRIAQNDDELPF